MSELRRILAELWAERARVGLVALGVLWGTLSLGILFAFGASMSAATSATADTFGVRLLRVHARATSRPHEGLPAGRALRMTAEDVAALAAIPGVRGVAWEHARGGLRVRVGDRRRNVTVSAPGPGFAALRNLEARPGGRFLNRLDHVDRRRVCFLGARLAQRLFPGEDPVGRSVDVHGTPLTVVGVGPPRITHTNYNGEDRDKLTMPASTAEQMFGWRDVSYGWLGLEPGADRHAVLAEARRVLGARLRFDPADRDAVGVQDYVELRAMIGGILVGNRVFTVVVGVLGLLVSLVGVTNVMLALVEERTRELGVQLAIGARPGALAAERLAEGVVVTLAGGVAGLALCAGLLGALGLVAMPDEVAAYLGRPRLHAGLALGVLTTLVAAGALAGWLPARRAMRLDPVEVLREE